MRLVDSCKRQAAAITGLGFCALALVDFRTYAQPVIDCSTCPQELSLSAEQIDCARQGLPQAKRAKGEPVPLLLICPGNKRANDSDRRIPLGKLPGSDVQTPPASVQHILVYLTRAQIECLGKYVSGEVAAPLRIDFRTCSITE
jgi:hypothetical protein